MAHIKAGGVAKGNKDSQAKRLGVKIFGGAKVVSGNIIVRQRGTKFAIGNGAKFGKDFTIFSVISGVVNFKNKHGKKVVEVLPQKT